MGQGQDKETRMRLTKILNQKGGTEGMKASP